MLRILSYEKGQGYVAFWLKTGNPMLGDKTPFLINDGILEQYMEAFDIPAGAALSMLLLDGVFDDVDIPKSFEEGAAERVDSILSLVDERLAWDCDRNAALAEVTLALDNPDELVDSWRKNQVAYAESHQRMLEERQASEFVSIMPATQRAEPRDLGASSSPQNVESGITFVP